MGDLAKIIKEPVKRALIREFAATKLAVQNKTKNSAQEEAKKIEKVENFSKTPQGRQFALNGLSATKEGRAMTLEQMEDLLRDKDFIKGFADSMRYDFGGILATKSNVMEFNPRGVAMSSTGYGKPRAKRKPRATK
jgi:hypothetical protein